MKEILEKLYQKNSLTQEEAYQAMQVLLSQEINETQLGAFLSVFNVRMISLEEIIGFRKCLLENAITYSLPFDSIDLCGTGGDKKNTFNISTLTAIMVSQLGYKVTKHGNYGISSISGSSTILEYFGYQFGNDEAKILNELEQCNISFLHAPLFHPALKKVAKVRKALELQSFFNILGPLLNPVSPTHQVVGVYSLEIIRLYEYIFQNATQTQYTLVHNLNGYDELMPIGNNKITTNAKEYLFDAQEIGIPTPKPEELFGGNTLEENAQIFEAVLKGKATEAQKNTILINTALALKNLEEQSWNQALETAENLYNSGESWNHFQKLIKLSQS